MNKHDSPVNMAFPEHPRTPPRRLSTPLAPVLENRVLPLSLAAAGVGDSLLTPRGFTPRSRPSPPLGASPKAQRSPRLGTAQSGGGGAWGSGVLGSSVDAPSTLAYAPTLPRLAQRVHDPRLHAVANALASPRPNNSVNPQGLVATAFKGAGGQGAQRRWVASVAGGQNKDVWKQESKPHPPAQGKRGKHAHGGGGGFDASPDAGQTEAKEEEGDPPSPTRIHFNAEDQDTMMWAAERQGRTLLNDIQAQRFWLAQLDGVETYIRDGVSSGKPAWLAPNPRCLHWAEAQARRELEAWRRINAENVEMSQGRFLRVCMKWGHVVRAKCALLPRMVRMAMVRVRRSQTLKTATVEKLAKGYLSRRRVRILREERVRRGHVMANKIQANFRGWAARGRVTFKRKLLEVQVTNARLFEAQEAFSTMDEDGSCSLDFEELQDVLEKMGVVLDVVGLKVLLSELPDNSDYMKNGGETISFVDFCDLMDVDVSNSAAQKMQVAMKIFYTFDMDRSGDIDADELRLAVKEMAIHTGQHVTEGELQAALHIAGEENEGKLSLPYFVATFGMDTGMKETALDDAVDIAWQAFESIDADHRGDITPEELAQGLKELGISHDFEQCKRMFAEVDSDGSGQIDFMEFCKVVGIHNIPPRLARKYIGAAKGVLGHEHSALLLPQEDPDKTHEGGEAIVGKQGVCSVLEGLRVRLSQAGLQASLVGGKRGDGNITRVGNRGKRVVVRHEDGSDRHYNTGFKGEYFLVLAPRHKCSIDETEVYWKAQPSRKKYFTFATPVDIFQRYDHAEESLKRIDIEIATSATAGGVHALARKKLLEDIVAASRAHAITVIAEREEAVKRRKREQGIALPCSPEAEARLRRSPTVRSSRALALGSPRDKADSRSPLPRGVSGSPSRTSKSPERRGAQRQLLQSHIETPRSDLCPPPDLETFARMSSSPDSNDAKQIRRFASSPASKSPRAGSRGASKASRRDASPRTSSNKVAGESSSRGTSKTSRGVSRTGRVGGDTADRDVSPDRLGRSGSGRGRSGGGFVRTESGESVWIFGGDPSLNEKAAKEEPTDDSSTDSSPALTPTLLTPPEDSTSPSRGRPEFSEAPLSLPMRRLAATEAKARTSPRAIAREAAYNAPLPRQGSSLSGLAGGHSPLSRGRSRGSVSPVRKRDSVNDLAAKASHQASRLSRADSPLAAGPAWDSAAASPPAAARSRGGPEGSRGGPEGSRGGPEGSRGGLVVGIDSPSRLTPGAASPWGSAGRSPFGKLAPNIFASPTPGAAPRVVAAAAGVVGQSGAVS